MTIKTEHEFIPHCGVGLGWASRLRHGWNWYGINIQFPFIMIVILIKWSDADKLTTSL
jgi:hypothetical protein